MQILLLLKVTLLLVFAITEIYNNENLGHVMIYNYWYERTLKNNEKRTKSWILGEGNSQKDVVDDLARFWDIKLTTRLGSHTIQSV